MRKSASEGIREGGGRVAEGEMHEAKGVKNYDFVTSASRRAETKMASAG